MKRGFALLLPVALAACSDNALSPNAPSADGGAFPTMSASAGTALHVPGHILVGFRPGVDVEAFAARFGARFEADVIFRAKLLKVAEGREAEILAAMRNHPDIEYAELDYIRTFGNPCETTGCITTNDPYRGYKWDLHNDGDINQSDGTFVQATGKADADVDWLEAYDHLGGTFSGSALVGIADSGVNPNHEDLAGRVTVSQDFYGKTNGMDDYGHGTHVAGIAAAGGNNGKGVMGVAWGPNVKIASAKVCGWYLLFGIFRQYGCSDSAISSGVRWLADQGAHAINLSLGGGAFSQTQKDALAYARNKGALLFCATGNDGASTVSYPAAYPECVAVSATNWSDELASYSNYGPETELSAPGGDSNAQNTGNSYILSTGYDPNAPSNTSYVFMAGTSMATPQATGLAALLHANGVTGADNILARMRSTADDLGSAGRDSRFGFGRINVYRALTGGGDPPPPPPPPPAAPAAPSGLTATAASSSQINLAWTNNATNQSGFKIERCTGSTCTNFGQIATVGANVTTFSNTGLSASTTYRYRVRAYNSGGDSGYSNVAGATTSAACRNKKC